MFCCLTACLVNYIYYLIAMVLVFIIVPLLLFSVYIRLVRRFSTSRCKSIAFFHPYCNAGGGGERVLWSMIQSMRQRYPQYQYVVYTGDKDVTGGEIVAKVKSTFQIHLGSDVQFVFLRQRRWIEASMYPYFTLLLQSLGSTILGLEALFKFVPDVYVDSMGYSFTYPIFKYLAGSKIVAYVHYPIISTDMLDNVTSREASFNNQEYISRSTLLTRLKLIYYRLFAKLYGAMGRHADLTLVNSSWTRGHVQSIWGNQCNIKLIYPPCNTETFQSLPLNGKERLFIASISQFRPEKNHRLQISCFAAFLDRLTPEERSQAKLILIGSCRDSGDEARVKELKELCDNLKISEKVEFKLNINFQELLETMKICNIGIHTMKNEHFGIGIVELMAAGLIVIAHKSGGPKMDIITDMETGYLAENEQEYIDALFNVARKSNDELDTMRQKARHEVTRFSEKEFTTQFLDSIKSTMANI